MIRKIFILVTLLFSITSNAASMSLIKLQAKEGKVNAQYNLGVIYYKGLDIIQDNKKAAYWFKQASKQGDASAQYNLAFMYNKGAGVPKSYKQAVYWYTQAAKQGLAEAQYNLGLMFYHGKGVHQSYKMAYMWFNLARYDGYMNKDTLTWIKAKMSMEMINEAQSMSEECLTSSYKSCG